MGYKDRTGLLWKIT